MICPFSDPHQPLECYTFPFELDTAPPYEALSYVWGEATPTTDINFNGSLIAVRMGLAHALTRLRLQSSTRIMWVDALCINQKDKREKNHQVPLMGSIYSLAKRVIVWLGHDEPQSIRDATQCVNFIAQACRQYDLARNLDPGNGDRYERLDLPVSFFPQTVCEALQKLFNRPWFTRVWCVQEICLAQDAVTLYGDQEMTWSAVGLAASWIFDKTAGPRSHDALSASLSKVFSQNADLMCDPDISKGTLLDVLAGFRSDFESTDPRDKVYGLLNLVTEKHEVEALNVDYEKSNGQVYADTTLAIIRLYSRLTTLAYVTHAEDYDGDDEVRSWAPNWHDGDVAADMGIPEKRCPWSASGAQSVPIAAEAHIGYEQLRLFGIFYNTVTNVQQTMNATNLEEPLELGELHPFVTAFETIVTIPIADRQEHSYKLVRTLTAGMLDEVRYIQNFDKDTQLGFYTSFGNIMKSLYKPSSDSTENAVMLDSTSITIQADAYHVCKQRRIFLTGNGSYGLGPQCMRTGDVVVVLYGGNTPYVLRPKGDKYLFMGQAYVDDIMQGQIAQEVDAGKRQRQEFCIV